MVKKSRQDSAYVALRSMLQTRVLSQETRDTIRRAMRRISHEAAKQTLRQVVVFEEHGGTSGD